MKVWDLFMFRNELAMLQMRVEHLADVVHQHVLVEAPVNHQGRPKPLVYQDYGGWPLRVRGVVAENLPDDPDPWVREHAQRHEAWRALYDADDRDMLLICDVDEIPTTDGILRAKDMLRSGTRAVAFKQRIFPFAVDWELGYQERTLVATTVGHAARCGLTLGEIRDGRASMPEIAYGGWHFSWLGGQEAIAEKLDAFCHLEDRFAMEQLNKTNAMYLSGCGVWRAPLYPVKPGPDWPAYIREDRCPASWWRPRLDSDVPAGPAVPWEA